MQPHPAFQQTEAEACNKQVRAQLPGQPNYLINKSDLSLYLKVKDLKVLVASQNPSLIWLLANHL